jgi:D-Tyr-tRNAtyr deacylase
MIALFQRVNSARVSVNGERNAEIGHRRRGSGLTFDTHIIDAEGQALHLTLI